MQSKEIKLATHKSSEKRARQDVKRSARNKSHVNSVKTSEKKIRAAIASKDATTAQNLLKNFSSVVDKAAQKGAISTKSASRKVSRISQQVSTLK